jgi:hypothetical protein
VLLQLGAGSLQLIRELDQLERVLLQMGAGSLQMIGEPNQSGPMLLLMIGKPDRLGIGRLWLERGFLGVGEAGGVMNKGI